MIVIIDYGAGNLMSVKNALDYLGVDSKITSNPKEIETADKIVFPGVGSFGFMMKTLNQRGMADTIKNSIKNGTPFLGICLGLQALFEESEENTNVKGLGVFKGKVVKFTKGKVPQIGWNKVSSTKKEIFNDAYFYFVNSYFVVPENKEIIASKANYFGDFVSSIQYKNVTAVQFHPEKSGGAGLEFLKRWLEC